jgi:cellulose 1,4-beta-cellobiosidase
LLIGGFFGNRTFFSRTADSTPASESNDSKTAAAAPSSATVTPSPAQTPSLTWLCGQVGWPEKSVDGGAYIVQNNEWNSTAPECITTDGGADFTVANSSINKSAAGDPGGYPAIYTGCSSGFCTRGNKLPIRVGSLRPGTVTSIWTTTQPASGAYDVAYDIWFNHTPATSGTPDGGELMIWLAHRGGTAPSGAPVAHVNIEGYAYTIWVGPGNPGAGPKFSQITYVMDRAATSVQDLDISRIAADASRRGYIAGTSYLVNIQAGFEIWQGGNTLKTRSFAVNVAK